MVYKKKWLSVNISSELQDWLMKQAEMEGVPRTDYVRYLIQRIFDNIQYFEENYEFINGDPVKYSTPITMIISTHMHDSIIKLAKEHNEKKAIVIRKMLTLWTKTKIVETTDGVELKLIKPPVKSKSATDEQIKQIIRRNYIKRKRAGGE